MAADAPGGERFVLVACDGGARDALMPLAVALDISLADVASAECVDEVYWGRRFTESAATLLVVGTSDSVQGRRVESAARRAARAAGLPIAAIEDFPGNYFDVPDGEATLVLAESAQAHALCAQKLGNSAPRVEILSPARYDVYRAKLGALRSATELHWHADDPHVPRVLWAGQPETGDCLHTLEALIPALRATGAKLILKAHPRDPGYAGGDYQKLLADAAIACEDVTMTSVADALAGGPRLVVTQFSSVAIEAGFHGIPGLCVLLPGAGGTRLREKKGYDVPPFCTAGALAYVTCVEEVQRSFTRALLDSNYRADLLRCFDSYFQVRACSIDTLVRFTQSISM